MTLKTLTIGIDGSPTSQDALAWGARLAAPSGATINAVGSWQMPLIAQLPVASETKPTPEWMEQDCRRRLDQSVDAAVSTIGAPGSAVDIERHVVEGKPGPALVAASDSSDLLIVGRTGSGKRHGLARLAEIALGSTARYCIHHAHCPIATVPEGAQWGEDFRAVVGVDGSESSVAALEWALVHLPADAEITAVRVIRDENHSLELQSELSAWVDGVRDRAPSTARTAPVKLQVVPGYSGDVLVSLSPMPGLLVVGERGVTGVAARVLGSTADHVVRHAPGPVLVVPVDRTEPETP